MKKFYYMLLLAVISMTMVSCDEWECEWDTPPYYTHNVFGSWESYCEFDGYDEYHILGSDVESFEFYDNYRGRYYFYSRMGFSFIEFNWTTYNDSRILIWDDYGFYENLYLWRSQHADR